MQTSRERRTERWVKNAQRPRRRPRGSLWGPWSSRWLLFDAPRRAGIVVNQGSTAPPTRRPARRRQQSAIGAETARGAGVTTVACVIGVTAAAVRPQRAVTFTARASVVVQYRKGRRGSLAGSWEGRLCAYPYTELVLQRKVSPRGLDVANGFCDATDRRHNSAAGSTAPGAEPPRHQTSGAATR
jgi:hypothetical protein